MKTIIKFIFLLLFSIQTYGQHIDTNYYPEKSANVTNEQYADAKMKLTRTYELLNSNLIRPLGFADYWNVAYCYSFMKVDKDIVLSFLTTAKESDRGLFSMFTNKQLEKYGQDLNKVIYYTVLKEDYLNLIKDCDNVDITSLKKKALKTQSTKK